MTAAAKLIPPVGPQDKAGRPEAEPSIIPTPMGWLAHLAAGGEISAAERDAGEIIHRLGTITINDAPPTARLQFPWRNAAGLWSVETEPKSAIVDRYNAAIEAIGTERRSRAVIAALVSRAPFLDLMNLSPFSCGLEALAIHFWGKATRSTMVAKGVTLPDTTGKQRRAIDYDKPAANDNSPTPERNRLGDAVQTADGVRMRDAFERLLQRGQLDEDKETAVALYAAGVRYQTDNQLAQMVNFGSFDYSKPMVDGGVDATPITERVQECRTSLRKARAAMGERCAKVVDAVTLHSMTLAEAGKAHCGYVGDTAAQTAAKERLNTGLRALAIHYGVAVRRVR